MRKIWEKNTGYSILKKYVDFFTRISFREVNVIGMEQVPMDGEIIFAPNHCNTLMDALVVLQARKGPTVFGARADMFRKPKAAAALRWLRILPMARQRDGIDSVKSNRATFSEVVDSLENGVPFCIYPEGTHHVGHTVHPVKSGIFRIAEQAFESNPEAKLYIVPVGLDYSDFFNFRNKLTITFGKAVDSKEYLALPAKDRSEKLTEDIQRLVPDRYSNDKFRKTPASQTVSLALIPILIISAVLGILVWAPAEHIVKGLKDKAWSNTARFAMNLVMLPISIIISAIVGFNSMSAFAAILLVLCTAVSSTVFYETKSFIRRNLW